jgi:hypothetical protein
MKLVSGLFKIVMWFAVIAASITYLLTVYAPNVIETVQDFISQIGGK